MAQTLRFAAVRLLRIAFASCLVAVWLLATQHCGLEAAGLLPQGCCDEKSAPHGDNATGHDADGCRVVEGTNYKASNSSVKASQPVLVSCLCLICVSAAERAGAHISEAPSWEYAQRPRDWVPTWHFVQRTALSPRAPSLV